MPAVYGVDEGQAQLSKEIEGASIKRDVRSRREGRHEIFDIRELRFEVGGVRGFSN